MCENTDIQTELANWVDSYYWDTVSEQYDDLVKRPGRVVVPLICVEFRERKEGSDECGRFSTAIPSDTTTGEIKRILESLPSVADPQAFVFSVFEERYKKVWEAACCRTESGEVGTQLFHNPYYREVLLVEDDSWVCSLKMAYSHASVIAFVDFTEDVSITRLMNRLLDENKLQTSYFEIPFDAFQE